MAEDDELDTVGDETLDHAGKASFTPEEYERLKRAVFDESFRRLVEAGTSYFVLGKYDGGPREARLDLVKRELEAGRGDAYAFLMKDVPDAWEFWPTKFAILARRATFLVPVLEDSHGSHHWETGNVDQPAYRPRVHVLKRDYETDAEEREHFSAMVAHFVEILDRDGRVYRWATENELRERVSELPV